MDGLELIEGVFAAATGGDLEAVLTRFHPEAQLDLPYAESDGHLDREGIARIFAFLMKTFETLDFEVVAVHRVVDSDRLILEYRSEFTADGGAVVYENRYVGIYEFSDGLIHRWTEYANPVPFARALAALTGEPGSPSPSG